MKTRVAVIYGGRSGEHEVSLVSAESVIAAMDPERYEVVRCLIAKDGRWSPRPILPEPGANPGIDVVFPVLHGTFGEDGTMQGLFELAGLAYVGSGVLGSATGMDKEVMKRLFLAARLPLTPHVTFLRREWEQSPRKTVARLEAEVAYPLFGEAANLGSMVGISKGA